VTFLRMHRTSNIYLTAGQWVALAVRSAAEGTSATDELVRCLSTRHCSEKTRTLLRSTFPSEPYCEIDIDQTDCQRGRISNGSTGCDPR